MGNLFSSFTGNDEIIETVESDDEKIDQKQVNQIVSSINFYDSDSENYINEPKNGDPCALYVDGLSARWSKKDFKSFLKKNKINYSKANKDEENHYGTIYFESNQDRSDAYHTLTTVRFKNMILYVVPLLNNFKKTQEKCKILKNGNKIKKDIVDITTPWHSIEYTEQVRQKVLKYSKIIRNLSNFRSSGLIDVVECDSIKYYVNDVELAIGWNSNRKIAVGFNIGSNKEDDIAEIYNCLNIPECAITLSKRIRKFILKSGYSPFNRLKKVGLWKFVRIRQSSIDDKIMLVIGIYGEMPSEELTSKIIREFNDIGSLYYVETAENESFDPKYELHHLNGSEYLTDQINDCLFPIYPTTIFPTSTSMFAKIIRQISLLGSLDKQTLVIDNDAGYGLYTFPISRIASKVIAFEKNENLFESLQSNLKLNQIRNVQLRNGHVEDLISTIKPQRNQKVVVLIHSPHCGIRKKALYAIQKIPRLTKIVFISTNAEKIVQDCNDIFFNQDSTSSSNFYLDSYLAIDTAPHTDRATVILSISR